MSENENLSDQKAPLNPESLLPGLKFAWDHHVSNSETAILMILLQRPSTADDIAHERGLKLNTVYELMKRMKYKGVIRVKERTENGAVLYEPILDA